MDEIVITKYDPNWMLLFEQESARIWAILDEDLITRIEHFGSTAVPGLAAKPIIDLLIGVRSLARAKQVAVPQLERMGYMLTGLRIPTLKGCFLLKVYLRQHSDEAARYAQLKYHLAQRLKSDREAYTMGKAKYIESVMQKAQQPPAS